MNVAFFLSPKSEVIYLDKDMPLLKAMEVMRGCRYQALPVVDGEGKYYGVITEGDILWHLSGSEKREALLEAAVEKVPRYREYQAVKVSEDMGSLVEAACRQSFVPVVDDGGIFIGIIRRRDIIQYFYQERNNG